MQVYSDPERAGEPHALPDVEVFYYDPADSIADSGYSGRCEDCGERGMLADGMGSEQCLCLPCAREAYPAGWYFWYCFPGCMPDSGMSGPYTSAEDAERAAQDQAGE